MSDDGESVVHEGMTGAMDGQYGQYDGAIVSDDGDCTVVGDEYSDWCNMERGAAFGHTKYFNDLWQDVHAHRRIWVQTDYLSFWAKGNPLPPLVTTSPIGTPQTQAGILPESATTSILFGNDRVDTQQRNGARINLGYWLIDGEFFGIEGGYFALEQQNTLFNAASVFSDGIQPGEQILARPFVNYDPNLVTPAEDAALVAFPNFVVGGQTFQLDGSIDIRTTSNVQSANAAFRRLIWIDFTMQRRLDLLLGYRFFRLDDSVTINDSTTTSGGIIAPTTFASQDQFSARNQFHGGEIGLKGQQYWGRLSLELVGKIALGNNRQQVHIDGSNTLTTQGITVTNVGGLLTQVSNIGDYQRDVFSVLPESTANLRFDLTRNLRATLGYTFIYVDNVQRSGSAIDRALNPTQINGGTLVGEARPAFAFQDSGFWVHGVNAGIEYRW